MRAKNRKEAPAIHSDTHRPLDPKDLKAFIEKSLDADKAFDIITIALDEQTALADHMIIASGTSSRHVSALAQKLKDALSVRGVKNVRVEGIGSSDWVVLDAGDVIVHLFRPEVRSFYDMEKMWGVVHQPFRMSGTSTSVHV